ncbi:MAG: DUF480 domain-containing protein [Actinobacteria bacterium]|nr:MAG: DUF480 domain-containing protein [Actinomycetota bacterium]
MTPPNDLSPAEIRVLGCLLEKQRTTPDAYPLSLNALRAACNQSTNRDPVVDYDEATVRDALTRLGRRRWTRLTSSAGSRAAKFRHLLDEALPLSNADRAVLTVLMLRGPQTPGELKQRTDRLHNFADLGAINAALESLIAHELAVRLPRRPGQKEERYAHLLGGEVREGDGGAAMPAVAAPAADAPPPVAPPPPADDRLGRLEREVAALREELEELRARLPAQL